MSVIFFPLNKKFRLIYGYLVRGNTISLTISSWSGSQGTGRTMPGRTPLGIQGLQPKNIAWFWQVSTEEEEEEEEDPSPTPLTAEALSTLVFYMEIHLPFSNSPNVQLQCILKVNVSTPLNQYLTIIYNHY